MDNTNKQITNMQSSNNVGNLTNVSFYGDCELRYSLLRALNNHLISYNFHKSQDAYSPHALYDETGKLIYVSDNTVSIIDAKTSRITEDTKNMQLFIKGVSPGKKTDLKIQEINKSLVDMLNKKNNTSVSHMRPSIYGFEEKNIIRNKNILRKLYNDTSCYKDVFRDESERNTLVMNLQGREYFSAILSDFYRYNASNNFLSKNRRKNLFPNSTYLALRDKLIQQKTLTVDEICGFIDYLLQKSVKEPDETPEERTQRHHSDSARSHLINILYGMMYVEQKYAYKKMSKINEGLLDMTEFDAAVGNTLGIDSDDIYTEIRQKKLPSLSFKEIRGETSSDNIGGRTWIADEVLEDDEKKYDVVEKILTSAKDKLVAFYAAQGYDVVCDSFVLANKFKKGDIIFDKDRLAAIEHNIKNGFFDPNIVHTDVKNAHVSDIYAYNMMDIDNPLVSQEERTILQKALDDDNSKTGGNGAYADLKFRMTFHLIKKDNPAEIIYNQSYEHMIVNMNSVNEGGLSDHNIFLDPIKNIPLKLRISTAIDLDLFMDSVCGGIDKTIKELATLQSYIDDPSSKPANMPMKYIQKQFAVRSHIPDEILKIAGLPSPYTYLDLDKNYKDKEKIEQAVAEYLLLDQFEKGRLHWFVYKKDHINELSNNLASSLSLDKNISYKHQGHAALIKEALQSKNRGQYCICGGGSNNLSKACNSRLFSENAYIGVVDAVADVIDFFAVPVFTGLVSQGTHIKKPEVILGDVKSIYRQQKSLTNEAA